MTLKTNQMLCTLAACLLISCLAFIPLPHMTPYMAYFFDKANNENVFSAVRFGILALGLMPVISAFSIVELASLIIPPLRAFRKNGVAGRAKLNLIAIIMTAIIAGIQGYQIAHTILPSATTFDPNMGSFSDFGATDFPRAFVWTTIVSLTAGVCLQIIVAFFINARGLGNGFCVLLLLNMIPGLFVNSKSFWLSIGTTITKEQALNSVGIFLLLIVGLRVVFTRPSIFRDEGQGLDVKYPLFPQSIEPIIVAYTLLMGLSGIMEPDVFNLAPGSFTYAAVLVILVVLLSKLLFEVFGSEQAVSRAINRTKKSVFIPDKSFIKSTIVLVGGAAIFSFPGGIVRIPELLSFAQILVVVAIAKDFMNEWGWRSRIKNPVCIMEFDNVHLAAYASAKLNKNNIDNMIQGYHYRSLYFIFKAFVKIRLFVGEKDTKESLTVMDLDQYPTI